MSPSLANVANSAPTATVTPIAEPTERDSCTDADAASNMPGGASDCIVICATGIAEPWNTATTASIAGNPHGPSAASMGRVPKATSRRPSAAAVCPIEGKIATRPVRDTSLPVTSTVGTEGLALRPFAIDRLVVVASRDHLLAGRKRLHFADVVHEDFLGLAGGALQDNLDARAALMGVRLRMRLRTRSFEGICRLASGGVGLGVVPETAARQCRRSMRLASIRLADDWATRRLSVCVRSERSLTPPIRSLVEHLALTNGVDG